LAIFAPHQDMLSLLASSRMKPHVVSNVRPAARYEGPLYAKYGSGVAVKRSGGPGQSITSTTCIIRWLTESNYLGNISRRLHVSRVPSSGSGFCRHCRLNVPERLRQDNAPSVYDKVASLAQGRRLMGYNTVSEVCFLPILRPKVATCPQRTRLELDQGRCDRLREDRSCDLRLQENNRRT
jgi:hypothetical protein